ncbi:MAG: hypothetical protein IPO72_13590 [Saprospiraceae bacterium]|nr:hypothetical protein [Candidatus Vicinibacter affinis]MBK9642268.1 hypothetical protein [Candidatus Vicinibacter affinis]MBP6171961.1 hypothetical protein [Saprospiraceae bacterium]HQX43314.1 hypothetical protein [Saprospiraceae bacterium]
MTSIPKNKVHLSRIYERFKNIPIKAYYDQIAFFTHYSEEVEQLGFEESVEIKITYLKALFFLDKTQNFQRLADEIIVEVLNQETFEFKHKRVYSEILELKATLYTSQRKTEIALEIYSDLIRMFPADLNFKEKLFSLLLSKNHTKLKKPMASVVLLLIITITLAIGSSLFIKPVYPATSLILEWIYLSAFVAAVMILFGTYALAYFRSRNELKKVSKQENGKKLSTLNQFH